MKTVTVTGSIYNNYPLYHLLYGRNISAKAFAVEAAIHSLLAHQPNLARKELSIVELAAGFNEHRPLFLSNWPGKVKSYIGAELNPWIKDPNTFIKADCIRGPINIPAVEVAMSFYFTVNSLCNTRSELISHFKTTLAVLKKNGMYYMHFEENGYNSALDMVDILDDVIPVPPYHKLRKAGGINDTNLASLRVIIEQHYDRKLSLNIETIKRCELKQGEKTMVTFKCPQVKFRYWSDSELIDAAFEAGFKDVVFFKNKMNDMSIELAKMDSRVDRTEDYDIDTLHCTDLMFIA